MLVRCAIALCLVVLMTSGPLRADVAVLPPTATVDEDDRAGMERAFHQSLLCRNLFHNNDPSVAQGFFYRFNTLRLEAK